MATAQETIEVGDGVQLTVVDSGAALEALDRAAIDVQITTAKRFPRDISRCKRDALTLATMDEDTAGSMFYALRRDGKVIDGPSARLAEVIAYSWQNLRVESDIIGIDDKHITAMGACFDLERNVAVRVRVKRRITTKEGRKFSDDMIVVTGNAAASIALRNAVFKVVPFALVKPIYQAARLTAIGEAESHAGLVDKWLAYFAKMGVVEEKVCAFLGHRGKDAITNDDLFTLAGLKTALKDGETTIEEAFNPRATEAGAAPDLNERIRKRTGNGGQKKSDEELRAEADKSDAAEMADVD